MPNPLQDGGGGGAPTFTASSEFPALLKGFVAGFVFATVNKRAVLGLIFGIVGGIYLQQVGCVGDEITIMTMMLMMMCECE
jgi:hypothetical protein